jgi:[protein-PII] uridylyltransferase
VEPLVRTIADCAEDVRRSWSIATSFLDARPVAGQADVFDAFTRRVTQPWRHDRERLRHGLRIETERRHATHSSATSSAAPDLVAGRGGLRDLQALRWLGSSFDQQGALWGALDFLLRAISAIEQAVDHTPHRVSARLQERVAADLGLAPDGSDAFLRELYGRTRVVGFQLDGALAPRRDDRQLGPGLAVRDGMLVGERLPPLARAPSIGLRVANLVGLAQPNDALEQWAAAATAPIQWDQPSLEQLWLLLRAADWRAWDFLDVSGLLLTYLPELKAIWRVPGNAATGHAAFDVHSFLAVRRLHEWSESGDPQARRAWRSLRRRDWVYLTVLLHELPSTAAVAAAERMGLPQEACESIGWVAANYAVLAETATRRDFHDEDLILDLATRIRSQQRLSWLFLVAAAHDLAAGDTAWNGWKADVMRQLYSRLEAALHQTGEVGARRSRSLEQHRDRITRELERRHLASLASVVTRLPRRYVLTRSPSFAARHLELLAGVPLANGEVRVRMLRRRQAGLWDLLVVTRDRPGLLATVAGVITLRGATTLAADAATCADGLVLDVFTIGGVRGEPLDRQQWSAIAEDLQAALQGRVPLSDLLGARPLPADEAAAIQVNVDNTASQFFSVVEVRAPDQVGLLYRIAEGLHALSLDIHHARIATGPEGALDVFYVRDLRGEKLAEAAAKRVARALATRLRGEGVRYGAVESLTEWPRL